MIVFVVGVFVGGALAYYFHEQIEEFIASKNG